MFGPSANDARRGEARALQDKIGRILETLGNIRDEERLSAEEILIFLAVGVLGVAVTKMGVEVRPVPCGHVSDLLHIPRETVRRRVASLAKRKLATMTASGINISDPAAWNAFCQALVVASK